MFKQIKSFCYIKSIKESKNIKSKLLKYIEDMPGQSYGQVTRTDWDLPKDYVKPYVKYFVNILKPYMKPVTKKMYAKNWVIHNMWYQQYYKNSHHEWHTHPWVQFSSVYYVELPDERYATQFKNPVNNEIFQLNVKEGDLLIFPSALIHRSPKIKSNKRKTIISFNSSFTQK